MVRPGFKLVWRCCKGHDHDKRDNAIACDKRKAKRIGIGDAITKNSLDPFPVRVGERPMITGITIGEQHQ